MRDDRGYIDRGGRARIKAARRRLTQQLADQERVADRRLEAGLDKPIRRLVGKPVRDQDANPCPRKR